MRSTLLTFISFKMRRAYEFAERGQLDDYIAKLERKSEPKDEMQDDELEASSSKVKAPKCSTASKAKGRSKGKKGIKKEDELEDRLPFSAAQWLEETNAYVDIVNTVYDSEWNVINIKALNADEDLSTHRHSRVRKNEELTLVSLLARRALDST